MFGTRSKKESKRVYLDWAAASPLLPEAKAAMEPWLTSEWGNAGAIHQEGARAKAAVEESREVVARALGVRPPEIFFTGSGTEANNLAIYGLLRQITESGRDFSDCEVITTKLEHPSVLEPMMHLEQYGLVIKFANVGEDGLIKLDHLKQLLNSKTVLVSFAYANSEIGTVQPVKRISRVVRKSNQQHNTNIKIHLDAAQAPLWLSCDVHQLGVDLMTLDGGKCCGPKGVGILVKLSATELKPIILGGGQESGLRAATENVAGIVGTSVAIVEAQKEWSKRSQRTSEVRDEAIENILKEITEAVLNGPTGDDRVANNINISIPGIDTEFATVVLDKHGFAVSTKSACSGAGGGESAVVSEITSDPARASSTLRVTLGPGTTLQNLKDLTKILKAHVEQMAALTQK